MTTIRQHLEAIDKLSDPLPKTAAEAWDRLCLIAEEVEAALNLLSALEDELATQRDRAEGWKRRYAFMESHPSYVPDPLPSGSSMPATPRETKETT